MTTITLRRMRRGLIMIIRYGSTSNIPVSHQYELYRFVVHFNVTIVEIGVHKFPFVYILHDVKVA